MNKTSTKKTVLPDTEMNKEIDITNDFPYEPGNNVINNILNYSKALSIRKSRQMDYFEIVLN